MYPLPAVGATGRAGAGQGHLSGVQERGQHAVRLLAQTSTPAAAEGGGSMSRTREAPGVARLRAEEGRIRPARSLAFLAAPADPFLSADQERELFVSLKRQGKVRAKAGFADLAPYLVAYKQACAEQEPIEVIPSAREHLVVRLEPGLHESRVVGIRLNILGLPGVNCMVRGDFAAALREMSSA